MKNKKVFTSDNGLELIIKHRKSAVIFEIGECDDDKYRFKFNNETFRELLEYLIEISNKSWVNFTPKAWSVSSCMLNDETSYFHKIKNKDTESTISNLLDLSKALDLIIEVFAEEPGVGFEEHYIIAHGYLAYQEVVEMTEHCKDGFDTVEEFNNSTNSNISKKTFEDESNSYIKIGGFDEWLFNI